MFQKALTDFFLFLIHGYQVVLSPYIGGNCRFHPSCSEYSKDCFKSHTVVTAVLLTLKRLSKCHPLGSSGFDPAPPKKKVC